MRIRKLFRAVLLCFGVGNAASGFFAQTADAPKQAAPAGTDYSKEETGAVTPPLARQDSGLRAELIQRPDSADLLYSLAFVQRLEGKARESLETYTRAASRRKPTAEELRSVAMDYVMLNDYSDAIRWLEIAVQMDPRDAEVMYALGRCYYSQNRYVDAGKMFQQVLAIQPRHLKAQENLGLAYDATNRPDMAEDALRKAASWASPGGPDEWPFLDLGSFLLDQNRAKEAIEPLRVAAHIRQDCAACHEKLGRALITIQETANGLAELEQATRLDPRNPKTHYEFGLALRQAGQTDRAHEELALSQKLYSTHSQE